MYYVSVKKTVWKKVLEYFEYCSVKIRTLVQIKLVSKFDRVCKTFIGKICQSLTESLRRAVQQLMKSDLEFLLYIISTFFMSNVSLNKMQIYSRKILLLLRRIMKLQTMVKRQCGLCFAYYIYQYLFRNIFFELQ